MNPDLRRLQWLSAAAAAMTYLLIVAGGIVRVTGSGLGCPDWPLCYGRLLPPLDPPAIIEYLHRLAASFTSPLILVTAVLVWARFRRVRSLVVPISLALGFLGLQIGLGAAAVLWETPPTVVALHLAVAWIILGLVIRVATESLVMETTQQAVSAADGRRMTLAAASLAATFALMVTGAAVTGSGASAACAGWPLCDGRWWVANRLGQIHLLHRYAAVITSVSIAWLVRECWRVRRTNTAASVVASVLGSLFVAQVLLGAMAVLRGLEPGLRGLHLATASAVWGCLVIVAGLARRKGKSEPVAAAETPPGVTKASPGDYLALTKPLIVGLLLVTTVAAMVVAAGGRPSWEAVGWTLLGGALSAGGASALNQYLDRDVDRRMARTRRRPVPAGQVMPSEALSFGLALCIAGFFVLALFANLLSAVLALAGMLYYVLFYTMALKPMTPQNIVIGGGAGAIPTLVGWAAATGQLNMQAFLLFALVFFWTPPHFWALALLKSRDYARAGLPMLPVVHGERETRRQILLYTVQVVALTLLLPALGLGGLLFLAFAVGLGGALLAFAWRLWWSGGNQPAWHMYRFSSLYLAMIFGAMVLDSVI